MKETGVFMGRMLAVITAAVLMLGLATPAMAQDGAAHAIDDFVQRGSDFFDNNLIFGKIRISPRLDQRFIYDDNIWMNDASEPQTRGRQWDFISSTKVGLSFDLPVNEEYTKFFKRSKVRLLTYEADFMWYFRNTEVSDINHDIGTSLFAFLSDLTKASGGKPYGFFFDVNANYRIIMNPLDLIQRPLGPALTGDPTGIPLAIGETDRLQWKQANAEAYVGWRGNWLDIRAGYEFEWYEFKDDFYSQADHREHTFVGEIGWNPWFHPQGRIFLKGKYSDLEFKTGLLNGANIWDVRLGFEGPLFSKRFRWYLDGGVKDWENQADGGFVFRNAQGIPEFRSNPDDSDYSGFVGKGRVAFTPWQQRKTMFQLEVARDVNWSAIANYREDTYVMLTIFDELIPKKLDFDFVISYSKHDPSDGPYRHLFEVGAGLTYHLVPQVDLTMRYLFRNQRSFDEVSVTFVGPNGGTTDLETNSKFHQNIFSVGFVVWW